MFSYFAYGLNISSDIAIPEFSAADFTGSDLTIQIDRSQQVSDLIDAEIIEQAASIQLTREKSTIYVRGTGVYIIENGNRVVIVPEPDSLELIIRFYLVGTIMGVVLYQRNSLVLHASAVNINGEAVVFLGVSGEGKSSTAATFVTHGHSIITDDVAPIDLTTEPVTIHPGFPQVKVGQEIAEALGYQYNRLHAVHTFKEKRALQPREGFSLKPVPIKRIYVLTTDKEFAIAPMKASSAVTELARHSRPTTLYHAGDAAHFFQCASLAKHHFIYQLKRPKDTSKLEELVQLVEQDLSSTTVVSMGQSTEILL